MTSISAGRNTYLNRFAWIAPLVLLLLLTPVLFRHFTTRLYYPPGLDQDSYLASGQTLVESHLVHVKRPVYSLWIGSFYLLTGRDLKATFYLEKTASILLLSFLVSLLALKLFDLPSALLCAVWILNCKYLMAESNGSHAFAASLLVASALCLVWLKPAARLPIALLFFYLATLVRDEMRVPFYVVMLYLGVRLVMKLRRESSAALWKSVQWRYWIILPVIALGFSAAILARKDPKSAGEGNYLDHVFLNEVTVTYMERTGMRKDLPDVWSAYTRFQSQALPGSTTALEAIRQHPDVIVANVLYNIKVSIRVLPALFLAFDHPLLMLILLAGYAGFYLARRRLMGDWQVISRENLDLLLVWSAATCLIIPIVLLLHVSARQYLQLVPIEILAGVFILRFALHKFAVLAVPVKQ